MKKAPIALAATALTAAAVLGASATTSAQSQAQPAKAGPVGAGKPLVQNEFDQVGPPMDSLRRAGRTVHYSDTGQRGWKPVLFIGGTGTTARAAGMTDFFRTTRENLKLRIISVERNGFGDTEYGPKLGKADYTDDVLAVLDKLGVRDASVVAISGGGPYAADLAARAPKRVEQLHLAAAAPPFGPVSSFCGLTPDQQRATVKEQIRDPRKWWAFDADSAVNRIPGFTDRAEEDGGRSYYLRGQLGDPSAQVHEQRLYCERPGPDLSELDAPVFLYGGNKDKVVPPSALDSWKQNLPKGADVTVRRYDDSGHDVQYRHWDQIMVDLAGMGDRTVVCVNRKTEVLPAGRAEKLLAKGRATTGSCAWK